MPNALGGYTVTNREPTGSMDVKITVRTDEAILFPAIWVDGQRSYDTYVLINGVATYHCPEENTARVAFDQHEAAEHGRENLT